MQRAYETTYQVMVEHDAGVIATTDGRLLFGSDDPFVMLDLEIDVLEIDSKVAYARPSAGYGVLWDGDMKPLPLATAVCVFECYKAAIWQQIERQSQNG